MNSPTIGFLACLALLSSCREAVEETEPKQPTGPIIEETITSQEAYDHLKNIFYNDLPSSDDEIAKYCNSLDLKECLEIVWVTGIEGGVKGHPRVYLLNLERFGELDHLQALKKIEARAPKDLAKKGLSVFFYPDHVPGLIAILKGWSKNNVDKASQYALDLVKQQDRDEIWYNWDFTLSNALSPEESFVYFVFHKKLRINPDEAYKSLWEDIPYFWVLESLKCYVAHVDLSGDKQEATARFEKLIEHTKRRGNQWKKQTHPDAKGPIDIDADLIRLEFANHWSKIDFQEALNWWMNIESLSDDLEDQRHHALWFLRFGRGDYTSYQKKEVLKWMRNNPESWGGMEYFSETLLALTPDHPMEILNLICSLPRDSKRIEILCNLIFCPEYDPSINGVTHTFSSPSFLDVSEVQRRTGEMNLSPEDLKALDIAFDRRKIFESENNLAPRANKKD